MKIDVVNWNVNGFAHLRPGQLELIERLAPDVLLLQELTPTSFERLAAAGWTGMHALQLLPPGHRGRAHERRVRFSCAVMARNGWRITDADTNRDAPSPERWLTARLTRDGLTVAVGSFACPPGVVWHDMKTDQGRRIARWMADQPRHAFAGVDRNGPKYEYSDGSVELWPPDATELFRSPPVDRWNEALTVLHDRHPELRRVSAAPRSGGPLAVSYVRGRKGQKQTPSRYDVVYASDDFDVEDVQYMFDEAIQAGSDHALVATALAVRER